MFEEGTLVLITGKYWYRGKFHPIDRGIVQVTQFYNGKSFAGMVSDGNVAVFHKEDILIESLVECQSGRPGNFVRVPQEFLLKDNGEVCYNLDEQTI